MNGSWKKFALCKRNPKMETLCQILDQSHACHSNLLLCEQKKCRNRSRGTKDPLLIDKMIVKNFKRQLTSLAVT